MKNTFGTSLTVTLFGESHGEAIGAVLDGLSPGITVDCDYINSKLALRRASSEISTARREGDEFKILSGVFNGKTTGTPLCIVIENSDKHSSDYSLFKSVARPGHADYTAEMKYGASRCEISALISENALSEMPPHLKRCVPTAIPFSLSA